MHLHRRQYISQWSYLSVAGGSPRVGYPAGCVDTHACPANTLPITREGRRQCHTKPSPDSWRGEGMRGGGGRRGDERVARSVLPHVCLRRCHPGFRVEAGGGRVHTHLCRCTRSRRAPVSPPTRHRRLLPTRAASAPPTRASSPCPCPTPLLLCLSALPLAVTTHAAVAAKVAVEQRLQRLPPRSPLPSALGLAAVKPRPPHALSSPRIRYAVRKPSRLDLPPRV